MAKCFRLPDTKTGYVGKWHLTVAFRRAGRCSRWPGSRDILAQLSIRLHNRLWKAGHLRLHVLEYVRHNVGMGSGDVVAFRGIVIDLVQLRARQPVRNPIQCLLRYAQLPRTFSGDWKVAPWLSTH